MMIGQVWGEETNQGIKDVSFLMESSSYTVDFKTRTDDEIEGFMFATAVIFKGVIPYANSVIDQRNYELLLNLLSHFDKAYNVLKDRKKLTKKEYEQCQQSSSIMHKVVTDAYLRGLR